MFGKLLCSLVFVCIFTEAGLSATPRKWSSADGKHSIVASLVRLNKDAALLRSLRGEEKWMEKTKFSTDDRAFLSQVEKTSFDLGEVATVSVLTEGYSWKLVRDTKVGGMTVQAYVCTRENSTDVVTLTMSSQVPKNNSERVAQLKGQFNGMLTPIQNAQLEVVEFEKPNLKGEIPAVNQFSFLIKKPDGGLLYAKGLTMFSNKKTYLFNAMAGDEKTALQLMRVSETLIEKQESGKP